MPYQYTLSTYPEIHPLIHPLIYPIKPRSTFITAIRGQKAHPILLRSTFENIFNFFVMVMIAIIVTTT